MTQSREAQDTIVFTKEFIPAQFKRFVEELSLHHRESRPAAHPGDHAQEIWTNEEETVAIHLSYDTGTSIFYAWVHGFDIYPWVLAINGRFLTTTVTYALNELKASTTLEERVAGVTRLGLTATEPDDRVTETLREQIQPGQPEPVRLAAVRVLGIAASPEHKQILAEIRDADSASDVRKAAAAVLESLALRGR